MTEKPSTEEEMLAWVREYARKQGWSLNEDPRQLGTVIRGLVRNTSRFGHQYCPCRLRSGDEEKDKAIECPCAYHKEEIADMGHCHCNLFFK